MLKILLMFKYFYFFGNILNVKMHIMLRGEVVMVFGTRSEDMPW